MTPDEQEAESVKYNVARIVRLSSGNFAFFSHYNEGTINLIRIGTLEEIAPLIPSADECGYTVPRAERPKVEGLVDLMSIINSMEPK